MTIDKGPDLTVGGDTAEISVPTSDISSTPAMAPAKPEGRVGMVAAGTSAGVNRVALEAELASLRDSRSGFARSRRKAIQLALGRSSSHKYNTED